MQDRNTISEITSYGTEITEFSRLSLTRLVLNKIHINAKKMGLDERCYLCCPSEEGIPAGVHFIAENS